MRTIIEAELKDRPDVSNRAIAADLGVDHKTVAASRDGLVAAGEIPHHEELKGRDGVKQPAKKSSPPKVTSVSVPCDAR